MFKKAPPIHLYLLSCLIFVFGGAVFVWTGWGLVSGLIYFTGVVSVLHLGLWDILEKLREVWFEQNDGYSKIMKMDEPTRYQLGLAAIKSEVDLKIDVTTLEGNDYSMLYRKVPIEAWKMKIIAQACLNGTPFTIRQWTPVKEGKLLADPEYRQLEAFLLCPVPEKPEIRFIAPKNPSDNRQGFDWTPLGRQMLEKCIAGPLLS